MNRILRHVDRNDFKKTLQRQIDEQKKLAAQKLKECQKVEAERKQIEEIAKPYKSDWREETQLQESDWTPVAGSIANSSSQTFQYGGGGGPTATFSGLGGVEAYPSTVTVSGETLNTPDYSQLGLQGYAPPLGGVQRQTKQTENERIDAEIIKLEEQIKESEAKENKIIDAWNAELRALMDRHGSEWEAVLKKDGGYNPEKHKGLQARHDAEMEAMWNREPKTSPYETERQNLRAKIFELEKQRPINKQLDAAEQAYPNLPFMGGRVQGVAQQPSFNIAQVASTNLSGLINKVKSVVASLPYKQEIAQSILSNKPIDIPQSQIPKKQIRELINGIENSPGILGNLGFSYTDKPVPYSDDNFYELPNGEVRTHTPETLDLYPNNTVYVGYDDDGSNPLAGAGNAQLQLVHPKGGQPYIKYRDHAYHNLTSTDPGEVPDPISTLGSDAVHSLRDIKQILSGNIRKTSPNQSIDDTPNIGAMRHYPPNIRGDVSKTIKIPYDQFPPKLRKMVDDEIRRRGQQPVATSQASSLASQASSAVGLNPQQRRKRGMKESTTWSKLKKHR